MKQFFAEANTFRKVVVLMLWTFLTFVLVVLIFGFVSFWVLEILVGYVLNKKIYRHTIRRSCRYLMEHGRGFFEEHNRNAVEMEQSLRVWLILIAYLLAIGLIAVHVSSQWGFWIIPKWSIKAGCLLGAFFNGFFTVPYEASERRKAHIGRLVSIDEKNVGKFVGLHEDDFEVWLECMDVGESDIGKKFFVLGAENNLSSIMYSLELD